MEECIRGRIYKINCRNLRFGIYDGNGGFIGIREKFGMKYLFTEFHYDTGPPYGTVKVLEDTGVTVDDTNNDNLFDILQEMG